MHRLESPQRGSALRPPSRDDRSRAARSKLSGYHASSLDLLHPLPYNVPTKVPYTPTSTVTLTLIESNHMFGGTMFLIQGSNGAVLHTGDMRAEPWWCEGLTRNPMLSPYLFGQPQAPKWAPTTTQRLSSGPSRSNFR